MESGEIEGVGGRSQLPLFVCALLLTISLALFCVISVAYAGTRKRDLFTVTDSYMSARNTQKWWSLGLSFFASGMGSWLLFATPETGALSGWLGVVGYALSNALTFWVMVWLGPAVKSALGGSRGFTVADFVRERYGRPVQIIITSMSLFFMWIFLTAELTSIGQVFSLLCDGYPLVGAIIPVSVITLAYTTLGGVPASIITDRFQGIMLFLLGITIYIAVCAHAGPEISKASWEEASRPTAEGVNAFFVFIISVTTNQFLDQGMWQRIFSAESTEHLRWGLIVGGGLNVPLVVLFGSTGIMSVAARLDGLISMPPGTEFSALFVLLWRMPRFWLGLVVLLGVGLVSSTVDSLQAALTALIAGDLLKSNKSMNWGRLFCVLVNIPAIVVASMGYSVLSLFLISNVLSCAVVPSLGLAFLPFVTELAVGVGVVCGLLSIIVVGLCVEQTVYGGVTWFLMPRGPFNWTTTITFILVPTVTIIVTVAVSLLQVRFYPDVLAAQKIRLNNMKQHLKLATDCTMAEAEIPVHKSSDVSFSDNKNRHPSHSSREINRGIDSAVEHYLNLNANF